MRTARVLSPRSTSQASKGPATAPIAFWWKPIRSVTSSPEAVVTPALVTTIPPTTSLCPPEYFVVEWTTTSAPSDTGFCRYAVAKVLSTTTSAPASWATSAMAAMSAMPSSGFVGVSSQIIRVSGRMAARTASTSAILAIECSMPHGRATRLKSRYVPP